MTDIDDRPSDQTMATASKDVRQYAERLEVKLQRATEAAQLVRPLQLENACLRAGLDPESPGTKLLLATYDGPPTPEAVAAAFENLTASVLAGNFARGRTLSELAAGTDPNGGEQVALDDGPTEAELAAAQARDALNRVDR